jgi:hypothetical protein
MPDQHLPRGPTSEMSHRSAEQFPDVAGTWFHRTMAGEPDDTLRVSDAERDVVLKALGDHAAAGRLTLDELEQRADQALAAKTRGDLAVITADLPGDQAPAPAPPLAGGTPVRRMVAILSSSHHRGRFRAAGKIDTLAVLGHDEIDLREAEIEGGELTLSMISVLGNTDIYIPDSVELEIDGSSVLGSYVDKGSGRAPRPGAPVIRIHMTNVLSSVNVYRLPPEARGMCLAKARRLLDSPDRQDIDDHVQQHLQYRIDRHIERRMRHAQRRIERNRYR